jgi:hypothetical protein
MHTINYYDVKIRPFFVLVCAAFILLGLYKFAFLFIGIFLFPLAIKITKA